jgi:hypothetical protein
VPSRRPNFATFPDPAGTAAQEIRRLSEALALARFGQVLDEADEWMMWLGAAVPAIPSGGRPDVVALREASRGFESWLDRSMGLLLALGSELVRRAEQVRFATRACLRQPGRAGGDLDAGRRALEASLLQLERALGRARGTIRLG